MAQRSEPAGLTSRYLDQIVDQSQHQVNTANVVYLVLDENVEHRRPSRWVEIACERCGSWMMRHDSEVKDRMWCRSCEKGNWFPSLLRDRWSRSRVLSEERALKLLGERTLRRLGGLDK